MRDERLPTPNFAPGRGGEHPRAIVVHTTDSSYESAAEWFANPESGVSAHYLVALDGRVARLVDESDCAWHAGRIRDPTAAVIGDGNPNSYTIGIEFEDGGDPEGVERTDEQYRAGARLIARIAARWGIPLDRDHVIGHREVFAAKACPGNLDLARLISEARSRPTDADRPRVVSLLPARNAGQDLIAHLESVGGLVDAVIALDDGSSDGTGELLRQSSLVRLMLSNPRRAGYEGWDDAANRQRLLRAAGELEPRWVIFLDADERIDPEDAAALRRFLETDAIPGCAYGLELHRMWGEAGAATFTWVHRLFAYAPGLALPDRRLHFNPIPIQIPRRAWVRTSVRIRHLDSPERLAERRAKYAAADPERAMERRPARLLAEPAPEELGPWRRRDPDLPVLAPDRVAARLVLEDAKRPGPPRGPRSRSGRRLVCLLPVRNGAEDLPGYLESAALFADAVVALDDGSADETAEILAASPFVEKIIRNPSREDYRGWNDAANRQRLLDAAGELAPDWVIFLDADERIDPGDAAALRAFVDEEAHPESAYGFRVHRMIGGTDCYDDAGLWVYRLFAYEPGLTLPRRRLHLVPVPESIDRSKLRRTTVRIQHLAGVTQTRRLSRFRKYQEADADRDYQADYDFVLRAPGPRRRWRPRPPGLPVLADPLRSGLSGIDLEELDPDAPLLSAIVISRDDEDRIERSVRSVVEQWCKRPFEVIVVVSGTDRTAEIVRTRFPQVHLIELAGQALPGRARNAGVLEARGEYVSFPGSHVELPPGSLEARLEAHELGYPMVTGSILNGTNTRSGWAAYFLDHSGALPGRPSEELDGPPAHCSYVREFVVAAGGFPEHLRAGEDTVVNRRLFALGLRAYREQRVRLVHRNRCESPGRLLRHHFQRGRSWGRIVLEDHRGGRRLVRRRILGFLLIRYLPSRLLRTSRQVRRWGGGLRAEYRRSLPLVVVGAFAAWLGVLAEILRPERGKLAVLLRDERRPANVARGSAHEDLLPVDRSRNRALGEGAGDEGAVDPAELIERRA